MTELVVGLFAAIVFFVVGMAVNETMWRTDCTKIGLHVGGDGVPYKCEPRK